MKIIDSIRNWWNTRGNLLFSAGQFFGNWSPSKYKFADAIFYSILDLKTDLCNDVTLTRSANDNVMRFAGFKSLFEREGQVLMDKLADVGFLVFGNRGSDFWLLQPNEFTTISNTDGEVIVKACAPDIDVYVMRSATFRVRGISDKQACRPFLKMLDAIYNSSTTITERLGAFVVGTPATPTGAPAATKFSKEQKDALEKEIRESYGSLREQSQIMILPNGMNFQVVNLAGLDIKLQEKIKSAVLPICDQLKVPANQVALIDANSNKTLANGTELREGDHNKYQSFERLLNDTFINMATYYGLHLDYTIYNKPQRQITTTTV